MEVLFTFLAERYERRSVLITSNLVFSKWDQIFKDPMTTMAAIDRLVHHEPGALALPRLQRVERRVADEVALGRDEQRARAVGRRDRREVERRAVLERRLLDRDGGRGRRPGRGRLRHRARTICRLFCVSFVNGDAARLSSGA